MLIDPYMSKVDTNMNFWEEYAEAKTLLFNNSVEYELDENFLKE